MTEPFTQWVIEDHFPLGRPDWGRFGAQLVADVLPFETMKLRMLNGAHSTLAYLGYLSGYETVAEAMGDAALACLVERIMSDDIPPTLVIPQGTDVAGYRRSLLERFRNPALRHRTWQIAMDGSQKLPQRLLGPARDLLAQGRSLDRIALGVAAWMRYVTGVDEHGQPIDVRDPLAQELRQRADAAGRNSEALARSLLSIEAIFGTDLPQDPRFTAHVIKALESLFTHGVNATVQAQA
jgi:fructuronate reductase